jgi:hypothetical protein
MFNIVTRLNENRSLAPAMPVFCSESYYERAADPDTAYHTRWQVWTAFLNGAAGYGYGAQGVWQFFDPDDPHGETGKKADGFVPWRQAAQFPGSAQARHARKLLTSLSWWNLRPRRDSLQVDGRPNPLPTSTDLTPAQVASIGDHTCVIYIPRGNAESRLILSDLSSQKCSGRWFNPRTGAFAGAASEVVVGALPPRPSPANEDWVLLVEGSSR